MRFIVQPTARQWIDMPWIVSGIDWMLVFCARKRVASGVIPQHKFDGCSGGCYHQNAGWSSLVARRAHNPKVGGSNPPPATNPNDSQRLAGSPRQALVASGKDLGKESAFPFS